MSDEPRWADFEAKKRMQADAGTNVLFGVIAIGVGMYLLLAIPDVVLLDLIPAR